MEIIVSSFYKYIPINNKIENLRKKYLKFCRSIEIKGKILIAKEGINGSVSGTKEQINKFKKYLLKNKLFKDLTFRENIANDYAFKKMLVKTRKEIVTSGLKADLKNKGEHISPKKLKEMLDKNDDILLLDARNDYESKIGKFKNAITPNIHEFRQFKILLKDLKKYKDKKIVMYCTGGVRCEKSSALLKENGFKNVFQLEGGIINYINQFPDSYFEGRCFVFDNRISIHSGTKNHDISMCDYCHVPSSRYINCENEKCDKFFICCRECDKIMRHSCSKQCKVRTLKRNN
ncbi:rhodanese-related sulfurtransferase [Candidatus Woesearchaeota archaeon]|nr:rhodanese-related sulfurtransferase [Candidatus Woesearchaeota archaeon]